MKAAAQGNLASARLLLAKGSDVNAQNQDGDTALMWTAGYGDAEMVRLLLARKANVNLKNKTGKTALALSTDESIRKLLQAAGAR